MRAAREHPRITGAIAVVLALLVLAGMTAGGTLAGASSNQRAVGGVRDTVSAELRALRMQLDTAQTRNAYLTGEVSALQARLASAQRAAAPAPPAGNKKRRR